MKTILLPRSVLALAGSLAACGALAQSTGAPGGAGSATADGARIASQGAGGAVAACASCHGAQGEGNAGAGFPRLAGQSAWYLAKQLTNYADGSRNHPVMTPIAKGLTQPQREAVAGYYAGLDAPATKSAGTAGAAQRGATLASVGDDKIAVQSCANCHGPGGVGEPPSYPYLAGQHASYLSATLTNWKNGTRNTDPSQQMPTIAKRLSDADITAVSAYYAQLRAPSLAELRPNEAVGTVARPVPAATPQSTKSGPTGPNAATPKQGVGSEQGSPLQGGSQGIGGGGAASGSGPQGSPSGAGTTAPGPGGNAPPKRP